MRNSVFALLCGFLMFLAAGCADKEIFSKIEDASLVGHAPVAVKITGDKHGVVKIKNDPSSNIEVRITKVQASCSTERARSLGSDFDGYILIEVYHNNKFAAKAQMDFKTEPAKKDYEKVWRKLQKALKWD
ncbi:MAG TPA: hypothetical protein PKW30_02190 [Campylobacterales bacterium]|nr:hypothetical protein [Campylobacterales bacterium]